MSSSPPPRKGGRLRLQKRQAFMSMSRIITCALCNKRYITRSGSTLCVACRGIHSTIKTKEEKVTREPEQCSDGATPASAVKSGAATHVVDTSANSTRNACVTISSGISRASISATAGKENAVSVCDDGLYGQNSAQKIKSEFRINDGSRVHKNVHEVPVLGEPMKGEEETRDSDCARPTAAKIAAYTLFEEKSSSTKAASTMRTELAPDHEKSSDGNWAGRGDKGVFLQIEIPSDHESDDYDNADNKFDETVNDGESATDISTKDGGESSTCDVSAPGIVMDKTANKSLGSEGNRLDYRKEQHVASSLFFSTSGNSDSSYKCFICNADLSRIQTGLKGRMNHIKRCGKKYGIRAGDSTGETSLCDPEQFGLDAKNTSMLGSVESHWHENADAELAMSVEMKTSSEVERDGKPSNPTTSTKQQPINSYFTRPIRSLDKVLLQGARNIAKKQQISVKRKESSTLSTSTAKARQGGGGWKRKREAPTRCPSYKRISNTSILVDAFHYANPALPQTHFLSHFHADHYGGLTKHWSGGIIYCSGPTAALVHSQLGVQKKYLHPLPMNTVSVVDANGKPVSVTLLDANHCPGAVMFLFELPSGKKALHVGDFRWDRDMMLSLPQLAQLARGANNVRLLDELYLDTTYCHEKYEKMPTQENAIEAAVDVAVSEMKGSSTTSLLPNCMVPLRKRPTLLLFGSYTIGKEKVYMSCAMALGLRIYVEPRKLRILSALNFSQDQMDLFTTIKSEAQIWVVPMSHCSFKHMDSYLAEANATERGLSSGYTRVVAFRPTGWSFSGSSGNLISTRRNGNKTIHGIPYSEHSSFAELIDCLLCLRPKRIVPTVSVSTSGAQIELLLQAAHAKEEEDHYQ